MDRVIVVGGGLAGLAAGVECAARGSQVTIVERNRHLGGKMNVLADGGFSFDMGPTILTLPQVLRGIIERSGRRVEDYLELVALDPQWRCIYADGSALDLRADPRDMGAAIDRFTGTAGEGERYRRFLDYSRRMLRLSEKVFFYKDLSGLWDLARRPIPREPGILGDVLAMRPYSTVAATAHAYLRDPRIRQLVEHFLQYVGSSPFLAPAILTLIAAAQVDHGCWYAKGGTRRVAQALERILREEGADVVTGVSVTRFLTEGRRVRGVQLDDGRMLFGDAVISNADVQRTYRDLLGDESSIGEQKRIARRYRPACSGVVLYLGLARRYDALLHHTFFFSEDSRREFDDLYARGIPSRDPSIYVCAPSRSDESQAPPGKEALYVLVHVPAEPAGRNWEGAGGLLSEYRNLIVKKLERLGLEDLGRMIEVEHALTPQSIERLYGSEAGAIYGLASHGRLQGGFKPGNRSRIWRGLYLCGGSVNPGAGVPMALMSGVTAANALCEDLGCLERPAPRGEGVPDAAGVAAVGSVPAGASAHGAAAQGGFTGSSETWTSMPPN